MRKTVETDGVRLSYVDRPGRPRARAHPGQLQRRATWAETVNAMPADLRLILTEVRGHGQSWPPPVDGTIEQFADDVTQIADHEHLD
jgi:pimeloyl-ACP methyl ester carboxylesterase